MGKWHWIFLFFSLQQQGLRFSSFCLFFFHSEHAFYHEPEQHKWTNSHQKPQLHTVFHIIWWCISSAKLFFFIKTSLEKKKKTNPVTFSWKNFPPHKRDVVEFMNTKVPIRFSFNTPGRNTIICTSKEKMPARGAPLITAALVGNIPGETDVRDLLTKVFQTSAYNLKAIVNTAQKVNWAH